MWHGISLSYKRRGCNRPHPSACLDVNVAVQQFYEFCKFCEFYGIEADDGMCLAPDKRFAL